MRDEQIHAAVKIVKKTIQQWKEPIVGIVARESHDPFRILIACLLSLRTKDKTTAEASYRLFKLADSPTRMLKLPLKQLEKAIYPVGFYKTKARQIHAICQTLLKDFGGVVPDTIDELLTLKGVGRKTANVIRSVAFGLPGLPVDTHVGRLARRLGLTEEEDPVKVEMALNPMVPQYERGEFSLRVILHGRQVCFARNPQCENCVLNDFCPAAFDF